MNMKLYYSPFFTGACYKELPVGKPRFEKIVGDAGLLDYLELRWGIPGFESDAIDRLLAYRSALEAFADGAFYEAAFENDSLATAKEILGWRDVLVMEGFQADTSYESVRLKKLAEVERVFRKSALVGTPERWERVHRHAPGKKAGADIEVCHDIALLQKLIRETLQAIGIAAGRYDGLGGKDLPVTMEGKDISILEFGTVAEALRWGVKNNCCQAVICPDPFRMNAVLRNNEKALMDASAGGDSSITQLFRLGLSLLERPCNVKNLLEYLRAPVSPVPERYSLAFALKRDGGRGEEWKKALSGCEDKGNVERFLLSLLDADVAEGKVSSSIVIDWCREMEDWVPSVMNETRKPYLMALTGLCRSMRRIIGQENKEKVDVGFVLKSVKTLYTPVPVQAEKAMAGSWDAVDSHRSLVDVPASLLWLPCNGGLGTPWPYAFLLQEEIAELGLKQMADFVRYDFNLMADRLGQADRIVLCSCDYDCDDALEVHPAVTLCKTAAKVVDKRAAGDSSLSIFTPLRTIETGIDLYPKRKKKEEGEPEKDICLSATSIETLIGYPFDFVMDKKLEFKDLSSLQMSDLTPMQGTVAHYVFQKMLEDSKGNMDAMRAMLEDGVFEKRVDAAAEEKGAVLFQPEFRTLFSNFKETVKDSIAILLDILKASGLKPMASEVPLDIDLAGLSHITGSVDFYAETGDGQEIVVIDFKYSKGSHYIDKLKAGESVQLEVYSECLAKMLGKTVAAKAYYFFPIKQLYTDDQTGLFKGPGVKTVKKKANSSPLSARIRNSVDLRRTDIKAGKLEVEEGTPLDEIDYHSYVEDRHLVELPKKKDEKSKATVKAGSPFANPTKYPILKNAVK